jgi:L-alanine-DL-glutamate epimerase-like enolase superfamily enzyme
MVRPKVRISDVVITPVVMPKADPTWRFALAASPESRGFLVRVRADDGSAGLGYTTALAHLGAPADQVEADLRALGRCLNFAEVSEIDLDALPGSNPAKCGIDIALHDLEARRRGVPLHDLLGGRVRAQIALLRILALKAPREVAANARLLVEEGYRYLKIKLDGDLETDIARVRAVREAVGRDVHLTVDANQSYDAAGAIAAAARLEPLGVELFEQPVPAADLAGLRAVSRATAIPVEADESAQSLEDVRRLIAAEAVGRISLKLPKLGGLANARAAAALCAEANVGCRVGATVGSRILAAAALHFAAATPNIDYACELAEFARLRDDPAEGLEARAGTLAVPDTIGLGIQLREGVRA